MEGQDEEFFFWKLCWFQQLCQNDVFAKPSVYAASSGCIVLTLLDLGCNVIFQHWRA